MLAGFVGGSRSYVYTTPEKFENGIFHSKNASNVFHPLRRRNVKTQPSPSAAGKAWVHSWGWGWLSRRHRFGKPPFLKWFLRSALKHRAGIFKFLRFEEFFRNAPFSVRISVDCWPNRRNKVAFSNFSGVVWTRPQCFCSDRENSRGPVYKFTDGERVQYFPKRKWRKFIYHLMGLLKVC